MAYSISTGCIGCAACTRVCPAKAIEGERGTLHRIDVLRCIECGACGRICPRSAVLDDQGAVIRKLAKAEWKKPVFDLTRCIACGACEAKCPVSCISLRDGKDGGFETWPFLSAPDSCVSCGYCAFYCPMSCVRLESPASAQPKTQVPPGTPAASAKEEER